MKYAFDRRACITLHKSTFWLITYILFCEGYFNMVLNTICFHEFMLQGCYGVSHLTFFPPCIEDYNKTRDLVLSCIRT